MKLIERLKRAVSVLLASLFVFFLAGFSMSDGAMAADNNLSAEQQKAMLEQKIKEAQNKIDDLESQSSDTKEYLDALNEKITYLEIGRAHV